MGTIAEYKIGNHIFANEFHNGKLKDNFDLN